MPLIRHELCTTSTSYTCVQLDIKFAPKSDLTIALDEEESLWIEIKAKIRKTIVRGVTFKGIWKLSWTNSTAVLIKYAGEERSVLFICHGKQTPTEEFSYCFQYQTI